MGTSEELPQDYRDEIANACCCGRTLTELKFLTPETDEDVLPTLGFIMMMLHVGQTGGERPDDSRGSKDTFTAPVFAELTP